MKRIPAFTVALAAIIGVILLAWPRNKPVADDKKPLVCFVGGTMTPVFKALAKAYHDATGANVDITTADSGELLAAIEMQQRGDLYVAHDPFTDIAMHRGIGVSAWRLGELYPVIIVNKGNPKNILSIADLMRPDVRVYLTDYEHSTLGYMLPILFKRAGLNFEQFNRSKQIPTHRSGSWVANQIIMKVADAAIVWQVVAKLRQKDLDTNTLATVLPRPDIDAVSSATGKQYDIAPVKVGMVSLTYSKRPRDIAKFVDFVNSDAGRKIFVENGFQASDMYGKQVYRDGIKLPKAGSDNVVMQQNAACSDKK